MTWSKEEREEAMNDLVKTLLVVERIEAQDISNKYNPQSVGELREVSLAFWAAKEFVRKKHGIDFAPVKGFPGLFQRATWEKIIGRSRRQRAAGVRKEKRALERMMLAASLAPEEAKEKLEKSADRMRLKMALGKKSRIGLPGLEE